MMKRALLLLLLLASPALAQQDIPISGLPTGSPMQPTDMIPIARSGFNYKLLGSDILTQANSIDPSGACQLGRTAINTASNVLFICYGASWHAIGGSAGSWGGITGTLSNQTDLQTALNAKCNLSGCTFTGPILVGNGSHAAPSYSFSTNSTGGLFLDLGFYTTLRGIDITGTDQSGGVTQIYPGKGTGIGAGGNVVIVAYPPNAASGTTPNSPVNFAIFQSNLGNILMGGLSLASGTPGASQFYGANAGSGRTDTAGGGMLFRAGQGTGTGVGGSFSIGIAPPATTTGTTQNAIQTGFNLSGTDGSFALGGLNAPTGAASTITGAGSVSANVAGGALTVKGGPATNGNANGGDVTLTGGTGIGSGIAGQIIITSRTFANLGTPGNGAIAMCSDCAPTIPCTGGGTGAYAYRIAGAWTCSGSSGPFLAPDGSTSAPGYSWSSNSGVGIYKTGNAQIVALAGADRFAWGFSTGNDFVLRSDGEVRFSSTADPKGSADTFISRIGVGVLAAKSVAGTGNWFQNTAGRFSLASDYTNATTTFSNLGLSTIQLISGRRYDFILNLFLTESTAADGVKIDFNGGIATVSTFLAQCTLTNDTGTAVTQANATSAALATVINATATTTTNVHLYTCMGFIVPSSSNTFIVRAAQNSHSSGTLTVKAGSWIMLEDTP